MNERGDWVRCGFGGHEAGHADAAAGRGSVRRYRKAVAARADEWPNEWRDWRTGSDRREVFGPGPGLDVVAVEYFDALGVLHVVPMQPYCDRQRRAAERCRRLLHRLDGVEG